MAIVAVTGGTGFVGSHLVRLLCERGEHCRVLVRPSSKIEILRDQPVEFIPGDLLDKSSLTRLMDGASVVYHVAADYRLWSPDPNELYKSNIDGTKNILNAAADAKTPKIVYTSTVGCLGIPKDGTPGDEKTPVCLDDMIGHYKRSKFLAEQVALEAARNGQPVIIVNPSTPVGPGDHKPTPTGKVIVDSINGKIPAFVDTGLNLIDVRDVAAGHILAAEKGRIGEKYILGAKNLTLAQILAVIAAACDKEPPRIKIPYSFAYLVGLLSTSWSNVTRKPPGVSLESVRMSKKKMFFSSKKAVKELGLPQSPIERALLDAIAWFFDNGYVECKR